MRIVETRKGHNSRRGKGSLFLAHVSLFSTLKLSPICKKFFAVPLLAAQIGTRRPTTTKETSN